MTSQFSYDLNTKNSDCLANKKLGGKKLVMILQSFFKVLFQELFKTEAEHYKI